MNPGVPGFKAGLAALFCGTSGRSAPCAPVLEASLARPEGRRRYLLALPSRPAAGKRPLLVMLHGAGASARQLLGMGFPPSPLSVWREIAEREQIVVIALDALGGWNDCFASAERVAKKDDVAFVGAIIDRATAEHDVDPERVYLTGVSRGGLLAYRVAVEIPRKLAAFAAVLACMPPPGRAAAPKVPLPTLIVGCTADPLMPYEGGKRFHTLGFMDPVSSIADSVEVWRRLAGLPSTPAVQEIPHLNPWDKTRATRFTWGAAADRLQVCLYRIEGGGHAEPSGLERYPYFINKLAGNQNADFETAEATWEFFRDKRAGDA